MKSTCCFMMIVITNKYLYYLLYLKLLFTRFINHLSKGIIPVSLFTFFLGPHNAIPK